MKSKKEVIEEVSISPDELCALFDLNPDSDSTDLKTLKLEAAVFNCCDSDWRPHAES